ELAASSSVQERNAAQSALRVAQFELEQARAALLQSRPEGGVAARFPLYSPVSGEVLRVFQESATIVTPGMPLLEVGDRRNLEIEIDVLSTDAVNIRPGARVWLEYWGGSEPLEARVRLVEPAGFTKISALGIEEQRVWIIADFVAPPQSWESLGDAYRIEARIITWESDDVLRVPVGALFRIGVEWAVFVLENDRAQLRQVKLGHRGEHQAEVLGGLKEGEQVILHPSDRVADGVSVTLREF
ncbi:MAG: efflux RND transporter periplasmic adaptor subunit, partial [Limisphaerales bacterium]